MLSFYLAMLDDPGEKERFEEIYNKYKDMMGRIAFAFLKDEESAFDATNDALVAIAKNIKTFPPAANQVYESAYVQKVIRHAAINVINKRKKHPKVISLDLDFQVAEGTSSPHEFDSNTTVDAVTEYIRQMSTVYRDVLTFRYLYEMSAHEIAIALGLSENTVRSRIRRGTESLRVFIEKEMAR